MKRLTNAAFGLLVVLTACDMPPAEDTLASYASEHALPFQANSTCQELSFLSDLVEGAGIVGLGETRHDGREFFEIKTQLIRCLITDHGVRHLVMEEGASSAPDIDDYLQSGEGDLRVLMNQMSNWFIWDTEEVHELLTWLRAFNENRPRGDRVRFYGMDMTAPWPAIDRAIKAVGGTGLEDEETLSAWRASFEIYQTPIWEQTARLYAELDGPALEQLSDAIEGLAGICRAVPDQTACNLETLHQAHQMYTLMARDYIAGGNLRDEFMAANLSRLQTQVGEAPLIMWSHNLHVARSEIDVEIPGMPAARITPLGAHLERAGGGTYRAVGFSFFEGVPQWGLPTSAPGSLDEMLAEGDGDQYFLNLGLARDRLWAEDTFQMRAQGGQSKLPAAIAFDAVIFVRTLDRTTPTPLARERFESMN